MKGISPDASWEGIMKVIRALAPVLEFPIADVKKVTKRKIIFYEDAVLSVPQEITELVPADMENRKIIPFPVTFRQPAVSNYAILESCRNVDNAPKTAKILPPPSAAVKLLSKQMELPSRRVPPFIAA